MIIIIIIIKSAMLYKASNAHKSTKPDHLKNLNKHVQF